MIDKTALFELNYKGLTLILAQHIYKSRHLSFPAAVYWRVLFPKEANVVLKVKDTRYILYADQDYPRKLNSGKKKVWRILTMPPAFLNRFRPITGIRKRPPWGWVLDYLFDPEYRDRNKLFLSDPTPVTNYFIEENIET